MARFGEGVDCDLVRIQEPSRIRDQLQWHRELWAQSPFQDQAAARTAWRKRLGTLNALLEGLDCRSAVGRSQRVGIAGTPGALPSSCRCSSLSCRLRGSRR